MISIFLIVYAVKVSRKSINSLYFLYLVLAKYKNVTPKDTYLYPMMCQRLKENCISTILNTAFNCSQMDFYISVVIYNVQ